MSFSLLEVVKARRRDKVFMAALAVYLGAYVPPLLDADKQHRIREQVGKMLKQYEPGTWKSSVWYFKAGLIAAAMARLDIDPMPGLKWTDLFDAGAAVANASLRWGILPLLPDPLPGRLIQHFHPYHEATEDARKVLRLAGYDVPERDPVIP